MILVLCYWFFLFVLLSSYGVASEHWLKIAQQHPILTILSGSIVVTVIATIAALFLGLSTYVEGALISTAILCLLVQPKSYKVFLNGLKMEWCGLSRFLKITFGILFLFTLAQSASSPYLLDNETYYIQTIKWIDAYGFVTGLANLHFFLSQTSGFHILQAATNLDFLFNQFNDLSGFILLLGYWYALTHLNRYLKTRSSIDLLIGLFPVCTVFFFQFVSAPSPDLMLYVGALIVFGEFLKQFQSTEFRSYRWLFVFVFFCVFCKLTGLLLVLFPTVLLLKKPTATKKEWAWVVGYGMLFSTLFLLKNSILTGYPLYPITAWSPAIFDWRLPEILQSFYTSNTKLHGYFLTLEAYEQKNALQLLWTWLTLPKLHGLFNIGISLVLLFSPFCIQRSSYKKSLWILYSVTWLQMILLWTTSPQYRYFFLFFMIWLLFYLHFLARNIKYLKWLLVASLSVAAIPLFVPLGIPTLTNNRFHLELSSFELRYWLIPHEKTRYTQATFQPQQESLLNYYDPSMEFFWASGDGPLPSVQAEQILYFKTHYQFIPQMRTLSLRDGFYSKGIKKHE